MRAGATKPPSDQPPTRSVGKYWFLLLSGKLQAMAELTRSQVNKAGKTLRVWWTDQFITDYLA